MWYQRTKYKNRKIKNAAGEFDSVKENRRFIELQLMEKAGKIVNLRRQVPFELVPSQRDSSGKVIERPVKYIADFVYNEVREDGVISDVVVEDTKGFRTKDYIIKRKLMLHLWGIRIREV